ncbi:MAG: hypothetical protein ABR610_09565 [Thermoanaerobaculia bacterium]
MTHPTDEDLLSFHWDADRKTGSHVAECAECAGRLADLRAVLHAAGGAPVPERGPGYGRDVWARLQPRLTEPPPRAQAWAWPFGLRPLGVGAAIAALILAGFLAGRLAAPRPPGAGELAALRQRVLFAELSGHLARSEAVLLELSNAPDGALDVSAEQARLTELLPANRLIRQSARRAGEPAITGVLDELERVLLDVEHGPSRLTGAQREALARRIEADGVLFRLRVLSSRIRAGERTAPSHRDALTERKRA